MHAELDAAATHPADDFLAHRDRAMLELFYCSGLRLSELSGLDLAQLDLVAGRLHVPGKDGRLRELPVAGTARQALQDWLARRRDIAVEPALFVGQQGRRLGPRAVQMRVRQAGMAALERQRAAHMPPHDFASSSLAAAPDAVPGHPARADIGNAPPCAHLDFQQLARIYARTHPRARRSGASDAPDDNPPLE